MATKPSDLFDFAVLETTGGAGDVTLAARVMSIVGLGSTLPLADILGYTTTPFSAFTPQVNTLDFAACTFADGVAAHITVKRLDTGTTKRYSIIPDGTSTTDARDKFVEAFDNDVESPIVAAAAAGSTMTLTENSDIQGFVVLEFPAAMTNVLTTPHVAPAGDFAEVSQYDSAVTPTGEFTKYDFYIRKPVVNSGATNNGFTKGHVIVFAEENDANFAAFDAALTAVLDASGITDAAVEPYVQVIV